MYFVNGIPRRLGGPEAFWVDAKASPRNGWLFGLLSHDALVLWSSKPYAVVAQYRRGPESVARDGTNVSFVWQDNGMSLAVLTSKGSVICVGVDAVADTALAATQLTVGHLAGAAYAEGKGIQAYSLAIRFVARNPTSPVLRVVGLKDHVLCVHHRLVTLLSWRGVRDRHSYSLPFAADERIGIARIVAGDVPSSYVVLLTNGSVCLMHLASPISASASGDAAAPGAATDNANLGSASSDWAELSASVEDNLNTAETATAAELAPLWTSKGDRATEIAFNKPFQRLVIGLTSGDIVVYSLVKREAVQQTTWATSIATTSIKALAWSYDGLALAVGYATPHVSNGTPQHMQPCSLRIYSVFGRPIATSDVHTDEERRQFSSEGYPLATELFTNGVRTIFWGPGGYNLFVCTAPSRPPSSDDPSPMSTPIEGMTRSNTANGTVATLPSRHNSAGSTTASPLTLNQDKSSSSSVPNAILSPPGVYILSFLKSSMIGQQSENNAKFPVLVGVTALLIDVPSLENQHTLRPDVRRWRQTQISPAYGAENWPIKYVAANAQGNMFALAGQRGFAILNSTLDKWKLFGNLQHERDFSVTGGMIWIGDVLAVAVHDTVFMNNELRFYSKNSNLDSSQVLCVEKLTKRCLHVSATGPNTFLVYTGDNILREYSFSTVTASTARDSKPACKVELLQSHSLAPFVEAPWRVRAINYHPLSKDKSALLILVGGNTLLAHLKESDVQVLSKQALFWSSGTIEGTELQSYSSLWIAEEQQVKFWLSLAAQGERQAEVIQSDFPIEFIPLGVILDAALVVGATSLAHQVDVSPVSLLDYRVRMDTHLFLHHLLGSLLDRERRVDAMHLAGAYKDLVYFNPALEVLLHQALESAGEIIRNAKPSKNVKSAIVKGLHRLELVVQFVEMFPQYLEVLVQCARKTEIERWEVLFYVTGSPGDLFQECIVTGRIKTAAQYLIILQNLESADMSSKTAMQLLETTLATEDYDTSRDLLRFLRTIFGLHELFTTELRSVSSTGLTGKSSKKAQQGQQQQSPVHSAGLQLPDTTLGMSSEDIMRNKLYLELLLARHSRKLVQKGRLRSLLAFTENLGLPLATLLKREHQRAAVLDHDYLAHFVSLHEQFMWNYPEPETAARVGSTAHGQYHGKTSVIYENKAAVDGESVAEKLDYHRDSKALRLKVLLDALVEAHCFDWALLVGVMLGDVTAVANALKEPYVVLALPPPEPKAQGAHQPPAQKAPGTPKTPAKPAPPIVSVPAFSATVFPATSPSANPKKLEQQQPTAPPASGWLGWFWTLGSGNSSASDLVDDMEDHFAEPDLAPEVLVADHDDASTGDSDPAPAATSPSASTAPPSASAAATAASTAPSADNTVYVASPSVKIVRSPNSPRRRRELLSQLIERLDSPAYRSFFQLVDSLVPPPAPSSTSPNATVIPIL